MNDVSHERPTLTPRFRDQAQRLAVCRALARTAHHEELWTNSGPTVQAVTWDRLGGGMSDRGTALLLGVALAVWSPGESLSVADLLRSQRQVSEIVGRLLLALAAGPDAIDRWLAWTSGRLPNKGTRLKLVTPDAAARATQQVEKGAVYDCRELLSLPHEQALKRIHQARNRFRSPALARQLLSEVRASLPDRPRRALAVAQLAEAVSWRARSGKPHFATPQADLLTLALAHQGNARRVLDDLPGAHQAFAECRSVVEGSGVSSPSVLAEIDGLEGSLRRDQRRFDDAERLLRRAVARASAARDREQISRLLIKLASVHHHRGDTAAALGSIESARRCLPEDAPDRLRLMVAHNKIYYLCELGEHDRAVELVDEVQTLSEEFDAPWAANRTEWLRGRIARSAGHVDEAAAHLSAAREGFAADHALYDAALVSLELAELHLEIGKAADARQVAAEALPLFVALRISREGATALAQLRRAVQEEGTLSAALLQTLARSLKSVDRA